MFNELIILNMITATLFILTSTVNNSIVFNSFSTLLLVLSQKLQNFIILLLISNHFTGSKSNNAYNTKFSYLLTSHFSTTNLPPFLIFSPYNQLVLLAPLQLLLSNSLPIPLGSKFLTDLSTFKLMLFGILYHTIFVLFSFFSSPFSALAIFFSISQAAENSPFFFIPILLNQLLYWTDPLSPVNVIHNSFHILHHAPTFPGIDTI